EQARASKERRAEEPGERCKSEDEADQDTRAPPAGEMGCVQARAHRRQLSRRVPGGPRGQDRLLSSLERADRRRDVGDRDEAWNVRRAREEPPAIAVADDR